MYVLIASALLTASAVSGPLHGKVEEMRQDTTAAARVDSSTARPIIALLKPIPALGTVESAVTMSFALSRRMLSPSLGPDTSLLSIATNDDSLLDPLQLGDTTYRTQRPRAIEYSEAYHTRLKIHQIGAYAMLPLFISEYIIGQKLLTSTNRSGGLKTAHSLIAGAVGIVFVSNTVTGAWNLWDARKDPNGRARRDIHSALMLASDIGFVATAISASNAKRSLVDARRHRTIAISSIALSAVGSGMMWLWRN